MTDTRDITDRLQDWRGDPDNLMNEAADTILDLRAEVERLTAALADSCDEHRGRHEYPGGGCEWAKDLRARAERAEAEAVALRADAERGRWIIRHSGWERRDDCTGRYAKMVVRLPYEADLSCVATTEDAIDAARAREAGND